MTWKPNYRGTSQKGAEYDGPTRAPSPEQPEHEEARRLEDLADILSTRPLTPEEAEQAVDTLFDFTALLSKAEQTATQLKAERDDNQKYRDRYRTALNAAVRRETDVKRELERLREAICAEAHHFPPNAVAGDPCYCGKAEW